MELEVPGWTTASRCIAVIAGLLEEDVCKQEGIRGAVKQTCLSPRFINRCLCIVGLVRFVLPGSLYPVQLQNGLTARAGCWLLNLPETVS